MQSLRLRAWIGRPSHLKPEIEMQQTSQPEPMSLSRCWFDRSGPHETPRFDRDTLAIGARIAGPAIIEDAWSTVVVPPGYAATIDRFGHLFLHEGAAPK